MEETGRRMFKMLTDAKAAAEPLGGFRMATGETGVADSHTPMDSAFYTDELYLEIAPGGAEAGLLRPDQEGDQCEKGEAPPQGPLPYSMPRTRLKTATSISTPTAVSATVAPGIRLSQ